VPLRDTPAQSLELLLDYMYRAELPLSNNNIQGVAAGRETPTETESEKENRNTAIVITRPKPAPGVSSSVRRGLTVTSEHEAQEKEQHEELKSSHENKKESGIMQLNVVKSTIYTEF